MYLDTNIPFLSVECNKGLISPLLSTPPVAFGNQTTRPLKKIIYDVLGLFDISPTKTQVAVL